MFNLPEPVLIALKELNINGFEGFIVGGCVRDLLLKRIPVDYDITTNALPLQIKDIFSEYRTIDIGIKHGTIAVVIGEMQLEITTYRIDGDYDDKRHPSNVVYSQNITEDLSRRDFTMNAIAYHPQQGIIDVFDGQDAIIQRKIVCVGDARLRFQEDALRILRAMRFSSQLGFQIENETSVQIHELKHNLLEISSERIHVELDKLIMGDGAFSVLTEYSDVIAVVIPEIKDSIGFEQHNKYHKYDVWVHSALAVACATENREVRLTMLLHDSGKPACFTLDENGFGHFQNHAEVSAELADTALRRLKYDNKTIEEVVLLIKYHSRMLESKKSIKRVMSKLDEKTFFNLLDVQRADNSAKKDFCLDRLGDLNKVEQIAREIIADEDCISLSSLDIDGYDLLDMGFKGKQIGEILSQLLSDVIDGKMTNNKSSLMENIVEKYNVL